VTEPQKHQGGMAAVFLLFVTSMLLIGLTFFLFIPILVFPAASIFCSIFSAYKYHTNTAKPFLLVKLILLLPIPAAIGTALFLWEIVTRGPWH